jgi:hypothetical protein
MVVEERCQQLWTALHQLRECWLELRLTLREDRPLHDATLLVEHLGDEADDGVGELDEALAAVVGLLQAPGDARGGGRALDATHRHLAAVARAYWTGLCARERQSELRSLARRRGGEWAVWTEGVEDALARVPDRLRDVDDALRRAWLELVERAGISEQVTWKDEQHGHERVPGPQRH